MSRPGLSDFSFYFRVLVSMLAVGLINTQALAWQYAEYHPYYRPPPYYYYPQPVYYQGYPPASFANPAVQAPVKLHRDLDHHNNEQQEKNSSTDISAKKQEFIQRLMPHIQKENARLKQLRNRTRQLLSALNTDSEISQQATVWLQKQAKRYRIKGNPVDNQKAATQLLKRIDIIPASLTLAQAANESAWGKSRFATQANNYFGIWTYDESKGLIPQDRAAEKKHLVRKFDHLAESVRYYMHMLNSHPAYQELRDIRQQARQAGQSPDGIKMAAGLEKYSARGEEYIRMIQDLIRQNRWARLDNIEQSA